MTIQGKGGKAETDILDQNSLDVTSPALDISKVKLNNLKADQMRIIKELLLNFSDLLTGQLGRTHLTTHTIKLTQGARPILIRPYRLSPAERQGEAKCIKEMLDKDIIEPTSSPWGFPNVIIRKKDGAYRITTNFKKLNELTIKDAYPLPRIDDALDLLGGAQFFTTLDANMGFFQVPLM